MGVGRKVQVVIIKRQRGRSSWIRFGEEGARILLKGLESLRKEAEKNGEGLRWRENGRRYSLVLKINGHGHFILCTVVDIDGKFHWLFFPEGNGLINGWTLLEETLKATGYEKDKKENGKPVQSFSLGKGEKHKGGQSSDKPPAEIMFAGRLEQDTI